MVYTHIGYGAQFCHIQTDLILTLPWKYQYHLHNIIITSIINWSFWKGETWHFYGDLKLTNYDNNAELLHKNPEFKHLHAELLIHDSTGTLQDNSTKIEYDKV